MAYRLIKQPNGKFAVFSTGVDGIIVYDATAEELAQDAALKAANEARAKTHEWVNDPKPYRKHHEVEDAVGWVKEQHGEEAAERTRKLLTGEVTEEGKAAPREHTVTITVKLTEEDLEAGAHFFGKAAKWSPGVMMTPGEVVNWHLEGAVDGKLHRMRSSLRWHKGGFDKHLRNCRRPSEPVWNPVEGEWDCEDSPNGKCWYDISREGILGGSCVFCCGPQDRK